MPTRLKALANSLSVRLLALLLVIVVAILTIHAVVSFNSTRQRYTEIVRDGAERCSSLILGATHDGMLANRKDQVQLTIERLGRGPGVNAIRVFDNDGRIAMSDRNDEVGRAVTISDAPCATCHRPDVHDHLPFEEITTSPRLLRPEDGQPVLHHLAVIQNEVGCAAVGCHGTPEEQPVLGVLHLEMSLERLRESLTDSRRQMTWTAVSLLLITGLVTTWFVKRMVGRPVSRLQTGTEEIAQGDLDTRIDVAGSHELAQLAAAFNRMAADLKVARQEVTEWSETLEEKVVEKTDELQRAQKQVLHMEKMASLGKLSATVAHELNNPISSILTYAKLVERELGRVELDPAVRDELVEYLHLMERECSRCGGIVKNLLLFARRRDGAEMAPVDLRELVERGLMLIRHHLEISNIELGREVFDGDATIHGDASQLEQALVALFVNAVEAMSGPSHAEGELSVAIDGDERAVRVRIGDTGVGIHAEVLPHIFEPFFSTKHEESGVGLGLAVVYGIVQRHGGTIDVESEPDRGTTFHLSFPRRPENGDGRGGGNEQESAR